MLRPRALLCLVPAGTPQGHRALLCMSSRLAASRQAADVWMGATACGHHQAAKPLRAVSGARMLFGASNRQCDHTITQRHLQSAKTKGSTVFATRLVLPSHRIASFAFSELPEIGVQTARSIDRGQYCCSLAARAMKTHAASLHRRHVLKAFPHAWAAVQRNRSPAGGGHARRRQQQRRTARRASPCICRAARAPCCMCRRTSDGSQQWAAWPALQRRRRARAGRAC